CSPLLIVNTLDFNLPDIEPGNFGNIGDQCLIVLGLQHLQVIINDRVSTVLFLPGKQALKNKCRCNNHKIENHNTHEWEFTPEIKRVKDRNGNNREEVCHVLYIKTYSPEIEYGKYREQSYCHLKLHGNYFQHGANKKDYDSHQEKPEQVIFLF